MKQLDKETLELYSDYIIASFWQITATWLSKMLDWEIWHDRITEFLSSNEFTSKDLWFLTKEKVREIENEDSWVIAFDDSIEEKQYMEENDIICWHYDHTFRRNVKGLNILKMIYVWEDLTPPLAYEIVKKTEKFIDEKTWKEKRKSKKNKNEMFRDLLDSIIKNKVKFKYLVADSRFCNKKNLQEIRKVNKHFVMEIPSNRKVSLSMKDKLEWKYQSIESLQMNTWQVLSVFIEWLDEELFLWRQVFINKDNSTWERYLICSDITLDFDSITTIYKKRWKIEESFKSLKSNAQTF